MKRKKNTFTLLILFGACQFYLACNHKFPMPLQGATMINKQVKGFEPSYTHGNIFFEPVKNNYKVRSLENATVERVIKFDSPSFVLIMTGEYKIIYGNLKEVYVKTGQKVTRKEIVGRVFEQDSSFDNHLAIYVQKDDKPVSVVKFHKW